VRRCIWILLGISLFLCHPADITTGEKENRPAAFDSGRALSLRVLQRNLVSLSPGEPASEEIRQLDGITRVWGYVIDGAACDVILIGDSDPSAPPLYLDDLVIALRNAWHIYDQVRGNTHYYSYPGCSIDPNPEILQKLQRLGDLITSAPTFDEVEQRLRDWHDLCRNPQKVRVMGIPFDSRFARVMVKADYDMKTLVNGSDSLNISGFQSLTDMTLAAVRPALIQGTPIRVSLSTLNRFWFCPGQNRYLTDQLAAIVDRCPVRLLTEAEYLDRGGAAQGTGRADSMALAFCHSFTAHYAEIAEKRSIYVELENLFRLVALAKLMHYLDCTSVAGLELDYLLNEYPVAARRVDRTLPGRSNVGELSHRQVFDDGYSDVRLWLPSCGGVGIEINPEKAAQERSPEVERRLKELRTRILQWRPTLDTRSWNYHLKSKTERDIPDELQSLYAALQCGQGLTWVICLNQKTDERLSREEW
jgi:hypothetical protein